MTTTTEKFPLTECHKDLITESAGCKDLLAGLLVNTWMTDHERIMDLMEHVTGRVLYSRDDFDKVADYLLQNENHD